MSNLYTEPSKDASYQVLIHFGQAVSEEKIFLEINRSETRMACGFSSDPLTNMAATGNSCF
jgi:hypothetical protein